MPFDTASAPIAPARDPLMVRMDRLVRINRKERALAREAVAAGEIGGERAAHAVLMAAVCREMGIS